MDTNSIELLVGLTVAKADTKVVEAILMQNTGGPTYDAENWFYQHHGRLVSVKGTGYKGVVHRLNDRDRGIYNGGRYPIMVKLTDDSLFEGRSLGGTVFEYSIDQLILLEGVV